MATAVTVELAERRVRCENCGRMLRRAVKFYSGRTDEWVLRPCARCACDTYQQTLGLLTLAEHEGVA